VLAAMTVLVIIVMALSRMFSDGSRIWRKGTRQVDTDGGSRAVVGFLTRRLMSAVVDRQIPFYLTDTGLKTYGGPPTDWSSELCFVTISQSARANAGNTYRSAEEFRFYVSKMKTSDNKDLTASLYRLSLANRQTMNSITAYAYSSTNMTGKKWYEGGSENGVSIIGIKNVGGAGVADYISKFQVWAYPPYAYNSAKQAVKKYDSADFGFQPPLWVDLFIEVITQHDASEMYFLSKDGAPPSKWNEYLARNARRYVARVSFINRDGYAKGFYVTP
jgi:hypothetical protein